MTLAEWKDDFKGFVKSLSIPRDDYKGIMEYIDDIPEPHWIPVTQEPTDRMICYVTLRDTNDENRQNWVAEMIYTPWDGFDLMDGIEAIAWMPKQYPEAYKGANA